MDCGAPIGPRKRLCDDCRKRHERESGQAQYQQKKKKLQEKNAAEHRKGPSLEEVSRAAAAAGMSYGKYVQRMAAGKAPETVPTPTPAPAAGSKAPEKERKERIYVTPARRAEIVRSILDGETTIKAAAAAEHVQYNTVWLWVKAARAKGEK